MPLEVVRRNTRICHVFRMRYLIEEYLEIVVETVFRAFPSSGRGQGGSEGRASLWSVGVVSGRASNGIV